MNINKVIVPDSIGDGVGRLSYKDGKVVVYEHGRKVSVYLFHEDDGEAVRAFEVTMEAPLTFEKCVNAAEMAAYGLRTAMDVASFGASLSRKQRTGEDAADIQEHDTFMAEVKDELERLGLAETSTTKLEQAQKAKVRELTAYDTSQAVNSFELRKEGVKIVDYWIDRDLRTSLEGDVKAAAEIGTTYDFDVRELGITLTLDCQKFLAGLSRLRQYAYTAYNVTSRHMAVINSLQTVAEVEAYNFTAGYPEKLVFNIEDMR